MNLFKNTTLFLSVIFSLASCENEPLNAVDTPASQEIIDGLVNAKIGAEYLSKRIIENADGEPTLHYKVQGDIYMTADQILHPENHQNPITKIDTELASKQYRTTYIVYPERTIHIRILNSGPEALSTDQQTGIVWAINDYNALNIGLKFTYSRGANRDGHPIVAKRVNWLGNNSGEAGFPTLGNPFHTIHVGNTTLGRNYAKALMMHELGHCIGLRHTNWYKRNTTCENVANDNEGRGWMGAVYIPGTSAGDGNDWNSVMQACIGDQQGFSRDDKKALRAMY